MYVVAYYVFIFRYVCMSFDFFNNRSSDRLHAWQVRTRGSSVCRVSSCLCTRLSRKLRPAIPDAKVAAFSKQAHVLEGHLRCPKNIQIRVSNGCE